ncbi:MAG: OmpH family outer membrane protein [Selenomonadaceae bacterium]|nr:OmpH family outer membrane protein [Selenomonadaceae bacterium]
MKKLIAAAVLMCSTFFIAGCGEPENVGYVDQRKIMTEAPQMKALMEEATKKVEEIEAEIKTTLENNENMSDEDRQKLVSQFERKMDGVNQAYSTQIQTKLDTALADICNAKNVSIVLDNTGNQKALISGGIDLTDEVINKLK